MKKEIRKKLRLTTETLSLLELKQAAAGLAGGEVTELTCDGTPLPASGGSRWC